MEGSVVNEKGDIGRTGNSCSQPDPHRGPGPLEGPGVLDSQARPVRDTGVSPVRVDSGARADETVVGE